MASRTGMTAFRGRSAAVMTAVMPGMFQAPVTSTARSSPCADVVAEPAAPAQQARVLGPGQARPDGGHFRRALAVATMASMMPW
jgi:hypothetical protein